MNCEAAADALHSIADMTYNDAGVRRDALRALASMRLNYAAEKLIELADSVLHEDDFRLGVVHALKWSSNSTAEDYLESSLLQRFRDRGYEKGG